MSKHSYKKTRLKYVFLAFTCATAFAFSGIASACGGDDSSDKDPDKTTTREDTQLLKNGNFEMFTIPDKKEGGNEPVYLIKTPENWSRGGSSSDAMSGIISTSDKSWEKMTKENLADVLDYNNKLDSSSSDYLEEYVDYNGMKSSDILYKDQYYALKSEDDLTDEEKEDTTRKAVIDNPGTHYNVDIRDGKLTAIVDGETVDVFENEAGEYFLEYDEAKKEYKQPISNVLMLHNYASSHNGIAQNYSSIELELPANTAAEVSLWVKTAYLKHNQGKDVTQDNGANITVTQTVGSSTLDKFMISCINTEKLINEGSVKAADATNYNNWVQYTVYINACDFASTKIKLELGLGETGYTTEGYAFFDDVTVTKYVSLSDENCSYSDHEEDVKDTTCNLSSDDGDKIFKADSYERNGGVIDNPNGGVTDKRFSENFYYFIDLASGHRANSDDTYFPVSFADNETVIELKTGYTVDSDNYVSSNITETGKTPKLIGFNEFNTENSGKWHLPFKSPLTTNEDLLARVKTGYEFTSSDTAYYNRLNNALNGDDNWAAKLPKNENTANNMLVMLSAYGAAYTTSFDMKIQGEGYSIISFWVKTSDMDGNTAATLSIKTNDDNVSNFTVDTTDIKTDISKDEKDIFNGWVQCFFFVHNELEDEQQFTVEFSFGNTTIKGTSNTSYKPGWVALANMQVLNVDEEIFSYTGSGSYTASLTITEETKKTPHVFDEAYANQSHEIKNDIVIPASYKGVNGGSSAVQHNEFVSIPFDEFNNNTYGFDKIDNDTYGVSDNRFTGLINKEYFVDGVYTDKSWYKTLIDNFNPSSTDAIKAWTEIFGTKSVQPLIINNVNRTSFIRNKKEEVTKSNYTKFFVKDKDTGRFVRATSYDEDETYYTPMQVKNYGYISEDQQISASGYKTISVRVKVSANAVAYIYLVDTSANKNVMKFSAPSYSFYYDEEGNVLKEENKADATNEEKRANIVYKLRSDGLYEDKDGKLYANVYNYKKLYFNEEITYFDKDGNEYNIDHLADGETYYTSKDANVIADHFLVTSNGTKVYKYESGVYHYIVEGKVQSEEVKPFDMELATPRYNYSTDGENGFVSPEYMVTVKGSEHSDWVTVKFVIHAGSEAKSYRLELWNGSRDNYDDGNGDGTVIFDYSYEDVTNDDLRNYHEERIISEYLDALSDKDPSADTTGKNIKYYEELADKYKDEIDTSKIRGSYTAHYYTYSLYDSPDYVPFNKTVAKDGATGYDYSVSEQTESLAYLKVDESDAYTIFVDYLAMDKSISLDNPSDNDDSNNSDDDDDGSVNVWLLASSIILVIALVFAIVAIFLKDLIKKMRRNKVTSKNNYDQRKANRYKRKLHLQQEEFVDVDEDDTAEDVEPAPEPVEDEVVEDAPAEVDEVTETPDEEVPVETEETAVEEAPAEDETPDDGNQE